MDFKAPTKDEPHIFDDDSKFLKDKRKFILYDNGPKNKNRIIIFSTRENLELLCRCETVASDGTFAKPARYRQVSF